MDTLAPHLHLIPYPTHLRTHRIAETVWPCQRTCKESAEDFCRMSDPQRHFCLPSTEESSEEGIQAVVYSLTENVSRNFAIREALSVSCWLSQVCTFGFGPLLRSTLGRALLTRFEQPPFNVNSSLQRLFQQISAGVFCVWVSISEFAFS